MTSSHSAQILRVANAPALAQRAAAMFQQMAQEQIVQHGRFTVALSGGSTPKAMLALLADVPYCQMIDWSRVYIFWGDERCVPPDHPDSNYRMTSESLLTKVPVPPENVFRMHGEAAPAQAAQLYTAQLRQFFQTDALPRFDLVFLGMGADGHTASLFPHTTALHAAAGLVAVENYVEKLKSYRLTLTAATINQARTIIFLVSGADKAPALREVLQGTPQPELYPSQLIKPINGELIWLVDEAAAQALERL